MTDSKTKEKMLNPWSKKNVCEVCNETCVSTEEKKEHEAKKTHTKKFAIKTFLNTYLKSSNSNLPSALARRFRTSKEKAAGLECLHEFRFPWCATGWWACSICYDSGCSLEQAEHHVRSPTHLTAYLEEFDPDKAAAIKKYKHNPIEYYTELNRARDELYETQGEIPPEVFELDMSKEDAMVKLVVANLPNPPKETLTLTLGDDETIKRAIVRCTVCHVVIPCFRKNLNKVWNVHENSPEHRKASAVLGILNYLNVEEVLDDENEESGALAYHWRRISSTYFGPICGKNHLLTAGKQNYCLLCQCVVNCVVEHFASEFHILRFLCTKKTQDIIRYIHQSPDVRRAKMMDLLSKITMDNDKHKKLDSGSLPEPIMNLRCEEKLDVEEFMFPLTSFGADLCLVCGICKCVIKVEMNDAPLAEGIWNDHVTSTAHFDVLSRQSCYRFYDEFFVPLLPTVKTLPPMLHGEWKNINVDDKISYKIQTQCDVGLEWIVEDQEAGEVVCTLCARTYKKDSIDGINNHIRSYMHLNQYLHYDNRDFLALLMGQPNEKSVLDLMLDWLQRTYAPVNPFYYDIGHMYSTIKSQNWGQIRVYSPEKATNIAKKMTVPHRMTQLPYYLPEFRPAAAALWPVIDQISNDGEDKLVKDLQDALMFSTCRIVWMDDQDNKLSRKWILRCMACQMLIPTTVETLLHDVFDVHLFDDEHDRRLQAYAQLEADRCRFAESTSNHTVKPFVQPNPVKKLSWHFNPDFSKYQYVLSVVGLEDMIERASSQYEPDRPPDFFCKLCALSIPKRHVALEQHVRSRDHIFNYVQKYFPMSIHELDAAKSDPKIERRVLANLVKDVKPSKEYPIPVFDPIGEQKRTQAMLEDEQNAKKKQDSLAVSRQKAEQLRLKREQEKLKILAREKENQDRIKNETLEREKKIRDASDRLKAETERLKEDLAREQKRKIKEEAEKARQFAIIQAEKDKLAKRQRNDHKTVLENELQKLQSLKKREEEKRKKEEFQFITERTNALSNKFQPLTHLAPPMMPHMNAPPPMPMNFSVPPPNFPGIGPKPVFNTFVPTVAAIPVYPMGAEDMDISHGRSRSPSPRKRRRSRSRSRSRERRSRRHSRSPPRRSPLRHGRREISPQKRRSISPIPRQKKNEPAEGRPSLRGRTVDLIIASLCSNRAQLVDYMWRQGAERIPTAEMPVQFSKKACSIEGNVGVDSVFEVVCIDAPELETYYCSICGIWGNPSEMIGHLSNPHHRLAFLLRNHKNIHANIMTEKDSSMRDTLLRAYIEKVWKSEKGDHPAVCHRLTTLLDRATIERVCPEYVVSTPKPVPRQPEPTRIPVPAPVQMDVFGSFASKAAYVPPFPPPTNLPPGFNTHFPPPPGMVPIPSVPILTPPAGSSKTSSRSDMRKRSRSPRGTKRRSRSRERRRSPSPRRRDDCRRSPSSKKRSPREDRDDRRRRSRSRSRSRRSGDRRVTESATASKDNINWASKVEQFIKKTAGSAPPVTNFLSAPTRSSEVITRDDAPTPVKDGQALQRKLLGLMCMMQTDVETTGNVDPNKIRQMAADMGINMGDKEPQEAIAALLESTQKHSEKTNFNLAEYGIQPMAQQPVNYPQYHPYQQQPPSMQSYQREDLTLTGILQGIPSSLAKLNQNPRPLSPIIKPMPYHFGKTEEYFKETSMSLVYPNDPEELQRENKEKQERKKQVTEKLRAKIADLQARTDKLQNNDDDDDWDSLENDLGQLIDKKAEAPAAPANTDSPEIIEIRGGPMRMGVPTTWQQPVPQTVKQTATPVQISVPAKEHIPIAPGQKMLLARTILPNGKAIPQPEAAKPIQQQFNPYSAAPTTVSQTAQAPVAYPFQQSQIYNQQAFNPVAFQQPPPFYQPGQYQTPPPQFAPPFQQQTVPLVQPTAMHPPGTDPQQQNYFYQQQYRY